MNYLVLQMCEWKEYKLGDFFDVKHGFAFKGKNITSDRTLDILVTPGNFHIGGGFKSNKFKYYEGDYPKEYLLKTGDIVITMTDLSVNTDTLGYSAKIPSSKEGENYLHNQRIGLVEFKNDNSFPEFLFWVMRSKAYQSYIVNSASGTSIMHTSPTRIKDYKLSLPPLHEQKAIAEVLSSLDDKIDLLHRQNETLEKMAETLFRKWFVEDAYESWEEGKLGDEFEFLMGQSPPGRSFNENSVGTPMYQGNRDFGNRFPTQRVFTIEPKRLAEKYDTLISVRAPVGEQNMAKEKCCIGRGVAAFRYKYNNEFYTYTYFKMKSLMDQIKRFNNEGTVFGSISKSDFENIDIVIPNDEFVAKFQNEAKPIDDKIILNENSIKSLEKLRDTLLPKLINGEVRLGGE